MDRFRRAFLMILLAVVTATSPCTAAAETADEGVDERLLYSKACVLMDGDSGRILYGKNADMPLANASTTKILTCIVCLEELDLSDIVTASKNAALQPKVHLGMKENERFYVKDLLYAMMLESYNDCAMALAEHAGGSMDGFAARLNDKAAELGCRDTYFLTPNGLDLEDDCGFHHTTAEDLCVMMNYCCFSSPKKEEFLSITQTAVYSFCNLDGKSYTVTNKNAFLSMMGGMLSGKTGYTSKAGYCYVAALESDGRRYTLALLACGWPNHKTYKWKDATRLFNYGKEAFHAEQVLFPEDYPRVLVERGMPRDAVLDDWGSPVYVRVYAEEAAPQTVLLRENEALAYEINVPQTIYRAIGDGEMIGKVSCTLDGSRIAQVGLYAKEACGQWNFRALFQCFAACYLDL